MARDGSSAGNAELLAELGITSERLLAEGRRGIRLYVADEHAIAQELGNGFTVSWTTDDSALTALQKSFGVFRRPTDTAGVRFGRDEYSEVPGLQVVPFAREKHPWWVKLRWQNLGDYVVFAAGNDGSLNELATLGPPLSDTSEVGDLSYESRTDRISDLFRATATNELVRNAEAVFGMLIETVAA